MHEYKEGDRVAIILDGGQMGMPTADSTEELVSSRLAEELGSRSQGQNMPKTVIARPFEHLKLRVI